MSTLSSSNSVGDSVESAVVDAESAIEPVGDSEATWHDARTTTRWDPTPERPFLGIPIVEAGTPVEIKGAAVIRSNGDRESPGHWYVKHQAHDRLLAAAGVYLLAVYAPRPDTPVLRSVVVPASLLDEHLDGRWYDVDGDRSEEEVAQLSWPALVDRERVPGVLEAGRRDGSPTSSDRGWSP